MNPEKSGRMLDRHGPKTLTAIILALFMCLSLTPVIYAAGNTGAAEMITLAFEDGGIGRKHHHQGRSI